MHVKLKGRSDQNTDTKRPGHLLDFEPGRTPSSKASWNSRMGLEKQVRVKDDDFREVGQESRDLDCPRTVPWRSGEL